MLSVSKRLICTIIFLLPMFFTTTAYANWIEQILNNPRVQALIGKPAEVLNQVQLCNNPAYRRSNAQACADADSASIASKMPLEMRLVMTNKNSAKALRDLCLAAQTTVQQGNYLCAELAKADKDFALAAGAARVVPATSSANDLSN